MGSFGERSPGKSGPLEDMKVWRADEIARNEGGFDILKTSGKSQLAVMNLAEGQASGKMGTDHPQSDQILVVLEGGGSAKVGDEEVTLSVGDVLFIPAGAPHQVFGPNKTLNFYAPVAYPNE